MLSEQEKSEIRASYKNAIDPRQHVKILMQLYLVSREEILDVLGPLSKSARPKPNRKGQTRRIYAPEFKAEAMELLDGEGRVQRRLDPLQTAIEWFQMSNDAFYARYGVNWVPKEPYYSQARRMVHSGDGSHA